MQHLVSQSQRLQREHSVVPVSGILDGDNVVLFRGGDAVVASESWRDCH